MNIRKPGFALLLSAISLAILVFIQVYMISQHYRLKENYFNIQYNGMVLNALASQGNFGFNAMDSAFMAFDEIALYNIPAFTSEIKEDAKASAGRQLKEVFVSLLNEHQRIGEEIKSSLKAEGMDTVFNINYRVNSLEFIDFDDLIPVYSGADTSRAETSTAGLFLRSYITEQNHFRAEFEMYIDFTNKTEIIIREMQGLIIVVSLTLFIVIAAFFITMRSLWKQKKLNTLKSDFIDNISHEFKTPLSSISLAATSLKHPKFLGDKEKTTELADSILLQNRTLNKMIDQVIDVSLVENQKIMLKREETDLLDFMENLKTRLVKEHPSRSIKLRTQWSFDPDLKVKLDRVQVERVMRNLFSNSVKYSEKEPCITLKAKQVNSHIQISVSDKGIGMDPETTKQIFNRFYRAENGRTRAKGLGLGLYIVKKIVEAHEGSVEIKSSPGRGTSVSFVIPVN